MPGGHLNPNDQAGTLCPACGLCCNGVLFGDVELQPGDDPAWLEQSGLDLFRKGRQRAFSQPCACHDGRYCRIYEQRPQRCRTFACGLLMRVASGDLTAALALKKINRARRQVNLVRQLVRALGQADEQVPLNRRYAAVMKQPLDLAGDQSRLELRGELMIAVAGLTQILERDFLTGSST